MIQVVLAVGRHRTHEHLLAGLHSLAGIWASFVALCDCVIEIRIEERLSDGPNFGRQPESTLEERLPFIRQIQYRSLGYQSSSSSSRGLNFDNGRTLKYGSCRSQVPTMMTCSGCMGNSMNHRPILAVVSTAAPLLITVIIDVRVVHRVVGIDLI